MIGLTYASGAPLPPFANANLNNARVTYTGETGGTFLVDQPLNFGSNGHVEISCRGTVKGRFTVSRVAGQIVLHEFQNIDTPGAGCKQMAGKSTDQGEGYRVIQITGDTLQIINGLKDADSPSKANDMVILTYKRVNP